MTTGPAGSRGLPGAVGYAARAEIVRVLPLAPGTGLTPIRSPAPGANVVAFMGLGAVEGWSLAWLVA